MGRRDLLSNTIYQRMKQLQSRLKRRNLEEEKRQERADRAKTARWEEYQKQMLQFENYLKRSRPGSRRGRGSGVSPPNRGTTPPNTTAVTPDCMSHEERIELEQVHLVETTTGSRSSGTDPLSSMRQTPRSPLSMTRRSVVRETDERSGDMRADWYRNGLCQSSPSSANPLSNGKSDLARGLEELDKISDHGGVSSPRSVMSNNVYSNDLSPPPTLPSTPSQSDHSLLIQTPLPASHETLSIPRLIDEPPSPQSILPDISITKIPTSSIETQKEVPSKHKTKKKPKPKKKLGRKGAAVRSRTPEKSPKPEVVEIKDPEPTKKEAKQKIKDIFTNANSMREEELTEEAFDVFLDTIKRLSEYIDPEEVDSQNFEVVDDLSSGFSSRANEYLADADHSSGGTLTPYRMLASLTPSPGPMIKSESPTAKQAASMLKRQAADERRQAADERRRQRILVVREKQAGIIRYRKVTVAELRLRRQRALMRVRAKLSKETQERDNIEKQRIRLFEMAHLNEKERLARLAQYKLEEEERLLQEAEIKRMKELRVKDELSQLLERSKRRQAEEERLARARRDCEDIEELEAEEDDNTDQSDGTPPIDRGQIVARTWKMAARRARNRDTFDKMIKQNSQTLYRSLVKELIVGRRKSVITDIPGFSYFLLLKYTLDPDDIEAIMSDLM